MTDLTVKDLSYAGIFAALVALLSYVVIPLPFSPVPITGQSLGVILAGIVLTTKQASLSMITFLLLGLALPVYSGGQSGLGVLFGPTGGYLFSYPVAAFLISFLDNNFNRANNRYLTGLFCLIGGVIIVHVMGSLWLGYVNQMPIREAFAVGSFPFIPGDLIKLVLAVVIGYKIKASLK